MKMHSVFQLIVFLNTFLFESIVGNIVTVGNYSQLNHKTCGLSRHSIGVDTKCLKWHKDVLSHVRGAMNASLGDAPWVTKLIISKNKGQNYLCSGAIISNQWILTAAHCMERASDIKICLGHTNQDGNDCFDITNEKYIHPKFDTTDYVYDIALVKMNKPIDSNVNQGLFANSICLPEKWQGTDCKYNKTSYCQQTEYGMAGGWGTGKHPSLDNLQIGYWRLYNMRWTLSKDPNSAFLKSKLAMNPLANQTICGGDSGGPVWQYQMGRAVIVGVISVSDDDGMGCETIPINSYNGWSIFVDQEIDWIKSVTMLN